MTTGILIPTFNRKDFLSQALESVLNQSHRDFEVIVIDNCSIDGTAEFMAGIKDPRVRYIVNEKNIGMIGSLNNGIELFSDKAEWCAVLSDDDLLDSHWLENLLESVRSSGVKSIVHSHRIFIDSEGHKIREARNSPPEESALHYIEMRSRNRRETYLTGVLFNRESFHKIGGYPEFSTGIASDDAFIFTLSLLDRLVFVPSAIASIRIHKDAESKSSADGLKKLETVQEFFAFCLRAADEYGNFTPEQQHTCLRIMERYRKHMNSYWWRTAVHAALDQNNKDVSDDLTNLGSRVRNERHAFSTRIRFNQFLEDLLKLNPESCRIYRSAGKIIDYIMFLFRNRLP
jgi:glycosyltransferase involved in cell wall biosynthesis